MTPPLGPPSTASASATSAVRSSPARRTGLPVWGLLALFLIGFVLLPGGAATPEAEQMTTFFLMLATTTVASIYPLVRLGLPGRRGVLLALVLAALVWLSTTPAGPVTFMGVVGSITTFLAALACCSAFRVQPDAMAPFLRDHTPRGLAVGLGIGCAAGLVLGVLNVGLALSGGAPLQPAVDYARLVRPLQPAISEEIRQRAVFLAFAVAALRGRPAGALAWTGTALLMTVPHLIQHLAGTLHTATPAELATQSGVLFVLFSVPFLLLQLRRDLTGAMVAHGIVDLIRFLLFGVPG